MESIKEIYAKLIGNNDISKVVEKFAISLVIVLISGMIAVYQNDPKWILLIPVLQSFLNYLKHYK